MKKINALRLVSILLISLLFSSCEAIKGIFKAGMDLGIFIVIAIIAIIVFVMIKVGKKK